MQAREHHLDTVRRLVAHGKDAPAALHLDRYALLLEEAHGILIVKSGKGAVEERAVPLELPNELRHGRGVREVAAPLARDEHLAADALHLLEQCDPRAVLRRRDCGHHAGGTGADDEDVLHRSTPASS